LEAALFGYNVALERLQEKIAAIRQQLRLGRSGHVATVTANGPKPKPRRTMSAAARKRIADAQKKRWAAFHDNGEKPAMRAEPKRTMSPERKAALVANLAKARATRAAKRTAA
jgi:hypothetical protein